MLKKIQTRKQLGIFWKNFNGGILADDLAEMWDAADHSHDLSKCADSRKNC